MKKKLISVFIVDDSRVARELLSHVIRSDPDLQVVGVAANGEEALEWLKKNTCDVITMDIHMPYLNGFEVTQKIMEKKPIPIAIVSAAYTPADKQMSFHALEAGALAILEKPMGINDASYYEKAKDLTDIIKTISEIKAIKRLKISLGSNIDYEKIVPESEIKAVAIGASLGGPLAICEILSELPSTFPVPIFIVQHIVAGFTEGFVRWLQGRSKLHVCLAKDKERAKPGTVYIAADNFQMEVNKGGVISLVNGAPDGRQPSIASLFKSVAENYGPSSIGVILTGMGRDGAQELLQMKQKGALTIAQDEESCLMFGIPKEAILLGAARYILPLNKIANTLTKLVRRENSE